MPTISKGDKVLVSGADGYIAMWATRFLLERGYSVRGTVRNQPQAKFLEGFFSALGYGHRLEVVIIQDICTVSLLYELQTEGKLNPRYRKERSTRQSRGSMLLHI